MASREQHEQRRAALDRDGNECQDCGAAVGAGDDTATATAEVHHKTPRAEGGSDDLSNLVTLCRSCHGARHTSSERHDEGRALLTEREREIIAGEADVSDNYRYKVESIVRVRVRKHLGDDIDVLREHFPEVFDLIQESVCDD